LDVQKQFQNFACGTVIISFHLQSTLSDVFDFKFHYFSDTEAVRPRVWSKDYILGLDPQPIPYDDPTENQEEILRFGTLDEPSLDYSVYDGHSTDVSSYDNIEPPLKDMSVHRSTSIPPISNPLMHVVQFRTLAWVFLR